MLVSFWSQMKTSWSWAIWTCSRADCDRARMLSAIFHMSSCSSGHWQVQTEGLRQQTKQYKHSWTLFKWFSPEFGCTSSDLPRSGAGRGRSHRAGQMQPRYLRGQERFNSVTDVTLCHLMLVLKNGLDPPNFQVQR